MSEDWYPRGEWYEMRLRGREQGWVLEDLVWDAGDTPEKACWCDALKFLSVVRTRLGGVKTRLKMAIRDTPRALSEFGLWVFVR